jgi:hypothetical protein
MPGKNQQAVHPGEAWTNRLLLNAVPIPHFSGDSAFRLYFKSCSGKKR